MIKIKRVFAAGALLIAGCVAVMPACNSDSSAVKNKFSETYGISYPEYLTLVYSDSQSKSLLSSSEEYAGVFEVGIESERLFEEFCTVSSYGSELQSAGWYAYDGDNCENIKSAKNYLNSSYFGDYRTEILEGFYVYGSSAQWQADHKDHYLYLLYNPQNSYMYYFEMHSTYFVD